MTEFATFSDLLLARFRDDAEKPAFTFLDQDRQELLSFGGLGDLALGVAGRIQAQAAAGDRVLIVLPPGRDYVVAVVACALAGVVAVPALSPASVKGLPRLARIAEDAGAVLLLTGAAQAEKLVAEPALAALPRLLVEGEAPADWVAPALSPDDLLFLQYTSGSTGTPKGVMVSHRNALANLALSRDTFGMSARDVIVSWLPPHHDFGLVGGIFSALFNGCHAVHLTPLAFLTRPRRWLQAISDFRATITGAPNFAWDLCVSRIGAEDRARLDLSSLRVAINGAERVRPETLTAFCTAFADCGFDPAAVTPAYGLAETTLLVAAPRLHVAGQLPRMIAGPNASGDEAALAQGQLVGHGVAPGTVIVGPEGAVLPEGQPGEIWVSGPSVARGYWRNPAETQAAFGHRLPGQEGAFFRTGDIGLIDGGELFIAGRSKEMMILAGRNLFPQDIEPDVEALSPAFRRSGAAVFTVEDGRETRLVVVQEVLDRRVLKTEGLAEQLRAMLAERHDIADLAAFLLVRTGDLPRTTSGKIQRFRCARLFAEQGFRPLWSWQAGAAVQSDFVAPRSATEIELAALWRDLLGGEDISIRDNFLELAGNSLLATQIISALDQRFGVDVSLTALFENPTIEMLAVEIDHALARRVVVAEDIQPRPVSPLQARLFYLDQFAPGDPIYTVSQGLRLGGTVDPGALERAAAALAARHEVLRYRFALEEGRPVAQLLPALDGLTDCRVVADLEAAADAVRAAPFDLLAGGLLRIALLTSAADDEMHRLILCAHRIVADDLSAERTLAELAALYSAEVAGLAPRLPAARQHAALAEAQLGWMASDNGRADLDWWRDALQDAPALLALPTDRPRPAVQDHSGARHGFFLSLAAASAAEAADLAATAFAVLLHRYSGQGDLCIGLPHRVPTGEVGPLTDMLPLRLAVSGEMRFGDLRHRLAASRAAAETRGAVPFDAMVEAVQPERHLGHAPVFQVALEIAGAAPALPELRGLAVRAEPARAPHAMYDLTLRLRPSEGGFDAEIDYATALFDAETIASMGRHLQRVLDQRTAPMLLAAPLPDAAEQTRILRDWNATGADYPEAAPLAEMFARQVAVRPEAACVVAEDGELSFAELNRRANRLAHALIAAGVGPDDLVGLCAERGAAMMVALLAILKAGAGYLPLDPALPEARLEYMIRDARPRAIVTLAHLTGALPAAACPVLLADDAAAVADRPETDPAPRGTMQTLAYCIYTSGSTGNPKGVMVAQGGVVNRLCWMTRAYGVAPGERLLQKTPYSFDVSVWELFWPLIAGATLVMARPGGHQDVAYLAGVIRDQRITTVHFVPPMLEFFIDYGDLSGCGSLRQILCSGQALPVALQNRVLAALPHVALRNLYGPTEASIEVSHWDCLPRAGQASVPIGHPIGNIRLYVLDAALNPVPAGVAGELFLAGIGLARGYLNRPDLTAATFVPDPFGPPGERMYRSGDLARHLPDGAVEYLGRIDDQVKIRGFRIELGEIEARLTDLPAIREALVVATDPGAGERSLIAYLVAEPGAEADERAVKAALLDRLPDYMVPAWFVWLPAFPVTANGKIDRRALPKPDVRRGDDGFVAPEGETQIAMAAIWAELLGRDRVGAQDRFFDLGGHSLLATQAISKIRLRFGVDVPLRAVLFDRPTVAELAAEVDALRADNRQTGMTAIRPAPRDGDLPLSFSQKRLWFLDQLEPGNPFYNIPAPTRLRGPLDVAALRQAINTIVARHDSLRTTFLDRDGAPVQVIAPALELEIPLTDLSALPDPEAEARRLAVEDAQTAFRLDLSPLVRARLLRLGDEDHVILFNMHHIISDGWSMGVLVTEFVALYRAAVEGRPDPLPPLAIQYLDFAIWQRDWLQGETLQRQLDYWRDRLAGAPPVLPLPTDRPRPPAQSYRGATFDVTLPADLTAELYALGARHQSTLFMVLLSAFNILLARHARVQDLCVGTYIANRNRAEIENLIGFFVNMLVLRSEVAPEASFETLLQQVRRNALDAYANQDLPFEYLVEELRPERHLSHSPLFQVVFVLQNTPLDDLDASGLRTEPLAVESHVSKFDLTLRLTEKAGALHGCFEYATDLFDESSIAAMAGQFDHLLRDIVRRPDAALADLTLGAAEAPAETPAPLPQVPVLEAFAARVAEAPDHPAVTGPGGLGYAALDRASDRLAHRLRAAAVAQGAPVGLCLDRGAGLVTAILACVKAGMAWLPLDPAMPPARQALILSEAQPVLVLAPVARHAGLQAAGAAHLLDPETAGEAPEGPLPGCGPDDPAYILYTSGTTGRPKGVVIPHCGVMNHAAHHIALCGLGPQDRVLQFATPAFDTSVEEILPTLMAGATLVPRPEGFLDTGAAFADFLAREGVTVLDLPTRFWQLWAEDSAPIPEGVRLVILGGEKVTRAQLAAWSQRPEAARIRLVNTYGPTEATIIATACDVPPDPAPAREIPIGRPIPGMVLRLLDPALRPVPQGMAGEIWLGGAGLALGYLNQPHLTADRFRADPYGVPGARLYRTGDLGRMRADGQIEFLGRVDDQIKLRGYRIEPAEIEAVLLAAGATQALVLLDESAGQPRLLAYATGADEAVLRRALGQSLPSYMLPSSIMVLSGFPLSLNGKVDRRALPLPVVQGGAVVVRAGVEAELAGLWAEVLGLSADRIGAGETFFALGGHSLLATQLIARVRRRWGIELSLRALFEHPTLEGLAPVVAAAIAGKDAVQDGGSLPDGGAPVLPDPVPRGPGPVPLSFAQQRLWFLDQLSPGDTAYNQPVALRLTGRLEPDALAQALTGLVARHEALRTVFATDQALPVQVILPPGPVDLPLEDLSDEVDPMAAAGARLAVLAAEPFDLARGPLLRARVIRLGPEDHLAALVLHHIVSDGWSLGVFLRELAALYEAALAGRAADLPPLPLQYGDYAAWQRAHLQGPELERQLAYWRSRLAGMPDRLALPTDRPRPAVQSHAGAVMPFDLPAGLTRALEALARRTGTSLHMVLVAVLSVLLARWSGQEDIAIGTPVAGRRHAALEGLIGFFVNTLVLRAGVDAAEPFSALLGRLREDALAAQAHQDLPFDQLVEALQPARDLSHAPLFQVMLALQNAPLGAMAFGGLRLEPAGVAVTATKFDLTFSLQEVPGSLQDLPGQGGLTGAIEYATDLFDAATIARLAAQFRHLAAACAAAPETRIGALPLMDAAERAAVVAGWAPARPPAARAAETATGRLDTLVSAAAARHPDRIALRCEGTSLTYAALEARANRLAHRLVQLGVGPETRVGLCCERSFEMIVGLLAVLKAGGAYVPLDPEHPDDRLAYMLDDAAPVLVLAQSAQAARLQSLTPAPVLTLATHPDPETGETEARSLPETPPETRTTPQNAAYVIYTSGSTGKPKGVCVDHRAIVNRVLWLHHAFAVQPGDRMVQKTPFGFDVSVGEIFLPLVAGGMLVIARPRGHVDVAYLARLVREEAITLIHFVPPMVEASLGQADPSDYASLRGVLCSGQALPRAVQDRLAEFVPHVRLHNLYGPTEAAVEVTHWPCAPEDPRFGPGVPIGRPIDNVAMYVLDDDMEPVPVGVPGHLFIAGVALARGYVNRPDLTAGAFIPDPLGPPGSRMYRTGDRARYLPNGAIDFLGRADDQLKIRGVRIEPGEVEAAIMACGIREAVVVAGPDASGELGLIAYVVARSFDEADLREQLAGRVPDFMMPTAFVVLEAVPLTPNGKVNRKALPAPDFTKAVAFVAPRTETEARIAAIWAEVLGREEVGVTDNFFRLGGHSLRAVTALNRLGEAFGIEIGLEKAFALQTVESLARHIDSLRGPAPETPKKKMRI